MTYINSLPHWNSLIKGKHLLFDTCAIVDIIHYEELEVFDEFNKLKAINTTIQTVKFELFRTKKKDQQLKRQNVLVRRSFVRQAGDKRIAFNSYPQTVPST